MRFIALTLLAALCGVFAAGQAVVNPFPIGSGLQKGSSSGGGGTTTCATTTNLLAGSGSAGGCVDSTIAPSNVPLLNAATNTFTGNLAIGSMFSVDSATNGIQTTSKIGGALLSGLTGVGKWTAGVPGVSASSDIIGLFSTCSGIQYLGADGACHNAGTVTGGTCTNQAVTAISTSAIPTCTTLTSSYVDNSIALTGSDISTGNLVRQIHETVTAITFGSSPYSVISSNSVITCDASGGAVIINLPAATGTLREITVKKIDSSVNACTLTRAGSDTIDGQTTVPIRYQYISYKIIDSASAVWSRLEGYGQVTYDVVNENLDIKSASNQTTYRANVSVGSLLIYNPNNGGFNLGSTGGPSALRGSTVVLVNKVGVGSGLAQDGSGLTTNGWLQVVAGAQVSTLAKSGGTIFDHLADVGNTTTTETDLYTDTLPGSMLINNGDAVFGRYAGTLVGSTSTKELRVYFGGTSVFDSGALGITVGASWVLETNCIRASASTVRCGTSYSSSSTVLAADTQYTVVSGLTLTNTQVLKITGQAASAGAATNDLVASMGKVSWQSAQ